MESPILRQISKFLQDKKRYKRWLAVFVCLAVVVGFATTAALKMRGKAMTHDERVLACKLQVHQHTEACYDQEKNIICGYADFVIHKHNDDCYDPNNGNLACTLPEVEAHQHTEECYQAQEALACGLEESEGHRHTEGCYTKEQGDLACQVEEHAHTEECQGEDGAFTCGKEEHAHTEECYEWKETLACGQEESEGHKHTPECSQVQKTLVCQKPEVVAHTHGDGCYQRVLITPEGEEIVQDPKDNTGVAQEVLAGTANKEVPEGRIEVRRTCGMLQIEEHTHTEEAGCIEIHEVLDGTDLRPAEEPNENPAGEPEEENRSQEDVQTPLDGAEDGEGSIAQTPFDGTEEKATITKTFEGEGFTVTAEYTEDADLPEEAELKAELITEESDPERYAQREAEYKEQVGDEDATMSALLKMGFYINGEEIEPKAAVKISVQMLDENGLPEGMPMTVVHFAEQGSEVIKGSQVENGETSFEMKSFSEAGLGYTSNDRATMQVSLSKTYKDDAFRITFHVEGEVELPEGIIAPVTNAGSDIDTPSKSEANDISGESATEKGTLEIETGADEGNATGGVGAEEGTGEDSSQEGENEDGEAEQPEVTEEGTEEDSPLEDKTSDSALKLKVKLLNEDSEEHMAYAEYVEELNDGKGDMLLRTLSYTLTYNGSELDASDCKVTVKIVPVNKSADTKKSRNSSDSEESKIQILAMTRIGDNVKEAENVNDEEDEENDAEIVEVEVTGDTLGAAKSETPDPPFTVQYYAYIDRFQTTGEGSLDLIDTSGKGSGQGKLPENKADLPTKKLYLKSTPTKGDYESRTEVNTKLELMEVYSQRKYTYIKAPSLNYFNALIENDGYKLKAIWLLRDGRDASSIIEGDWKIYPYSSKLHFTNRKESETAVEGKDSGYIYIEDDAIIRLVYDTTKNDTSEYDAVFYDYDISNGKLDGQNLATGYAGINSTLLKDKNGIPKDGQYAFGNQDWSDFGIVKWKDANGVTNTLNKANTGKYSNCTFGLVTGANGENLTFASGITAPKIFGTDKITGKTRYPDGKLTFKRNGDSYTLHKAEVTHNGTTSKAENLDKFWWRSNWNNTLTMWSNNFWPLDDLKGNDPLFGPAGGEYTFTGNSLGKDGNEKKKSSPSSDDNKLKHNCLFGMYYEVEFDLISEYTGPLEYVFFGDDDMWVFLDGKLVCDIGGVHASVGEYVNLWDWLGTTDTKGNLVKDENGKVKGIKEGHHTLQFFYTERGFSGSSCWMHFTLPSVTSRSPEDNKKDYGHLEVSKTVTDKKTEAVIQTEDEFEFTIKLSTPQVDADGKPVLDENGNQVMIPLPDDYSYWKYNPGDTEPFAYDLIIQNGGHFKLKNGQYIVIRYLPQGTVYTIEEVKYPEYDTEINGEESSDRKITGTINVNTGEQITLQKVAYNNQFSAYELPETGGFGTTLYTMAGAISLLFGAGFLYRKKFKEGRVGGSS